MAYSATVSVNPVGSGDFVVTIDETEASGTTEATITGLPVKGMVHSMISQLVSGTATTIDPVLGHLTDPASSALNTIMENDTAAAKINNAATSPIKYYDEDGTLFHRSVCSAGSDNTVSTRYYISTSWR